MSLQKNNILLLIADDLGRSCLGCYGNTTIQTPHIDRLATQGSKFDMAFTSTASCSASRSVIYTGLHTHENGQYGLANGRHHFTTFDHIHTAPRLLADRGYLTGIIGKVHVGPDHVYPWHVREESDSRDVAWVADRAAAFFERAKGEEDKPFFLTVGYIDPHRDLTRDGFGNDNNQFDSRVQEHIQYHPADVAVPDFLSDLPEVRQEVANYHRSISRLDQGIGFMMDALKRAGLEDDTLVMFLSDNGAPFINSKTTLYDSGVRLPLIVRLPGGSKKKRNVSNPNMVSYIDILPTFLDWAGGSSSNNESSSSTRLGRSFLPVLDQEKQVDGWQTQVFGSHTFHEITNYYPIRFMRTRRFKYHRNVEWRLNFPFSADIYGSLTWEGIRNSSSHMIGKRSIKSYIQRPAEELYDLESDPHEVTNLALSPDRDHRIQLERMRSETEKWQMQTKDPWLYRDGISVMLVRHHLEAGMVLPDRFDFQTEAPGTKNCSEYQLKVKDTPWPKGQASDSL